MTAIFAVTFVMSAVLICKWTLSHYDDDNDDILHRFRDMVTYWLKIAYFFIFLLPLSHSAPSLPMFPLKFRGEVNCQETRVMGLSSSEDRTIVAGVILA